MIAYILIPAIVSKSLILGLAKKSRKVSISNFVISDHSSFNNRNIEFNPWSIEKKKKNHFLQVMS